MKDLKRIERWLFHNYIPNPLMGEKPITAKEIADKSVIKLEIVLEALRNLDSDVEKINFENEPTKYRRLNGS